MLSESQLQRAAYRLLTSNTIGRYVRMAKDSARSLEMRLEADASSVDSLLKTADRLWREVRGSDERTMAEVKLAVVLAALRDVPGRKVDDLYSRIGTSTVETATWLAALARELLSERPESIELSRDDNRDWENVSAGAVSLSDTAANVLDDDEQEGGGGGDQNLEIVRNL